MGRFASCSPHGFARHPEILFMASCCPTTRLCSSASRFSLFFFSFCNMLFTGTLSGANYRGCPPLSTSLFSVAICDRWLWLHPVYAQFRPVCSRLLFTLRSVSRPPCRSRLFSKLIGVLFQLFNLRFIFAHLQSVLFRFAIWRAGQCAGPQLCNFLVQLFHFGMFAFRFCRAAFNLPAA